MDEALFNEINHFAKATPWLHAPILAYAYYGVVIFALLLLAGWWTARREVSRKMALALLAGVSTVVAVAVNQPIVDAVAEARPYTNHTHILVLAARSADFSFPSDHAVMAGAAAAGLWLASRWLGVIAAVAALLMAFARVYIGAHYPQDVLVGLLLGAAIATVIGLAAAGVATRLVEAVGQTPLRPIVTSDRPEAPTSRK